MPQNDGDFNREITRTPPGMPRWVKVFGIIALVAVLFLVMMMFVGSGQHGPGRHLPSGGAGAYTLAAAYGEQQR
jgi:hypothetical protein